MRWPVWSIFFGIVGAVVCYAVGQDTWAAFLSFVGGCLVGMFFDHAPRDLFPRDLPKK
jgi:hypothetical protein